MTGVVVALHFLYVVFESGVRILGCGERMPDDKVICSHARGLNGIIHPKGGHADRSGSGIEGGGEPLDRIPGWVCTAFIRAVVKVNEVCSPLVALPRS